MIVSYIQVILTLICKDKHYTKCYTYIISLNLQIIFEGPNNIPFLQVKKLRPGEIEQLAYHARMW